MCMFFYVRTCSKQCSVLFSLSALVALYVLACSADCIMLGCTVCVCESHSVYVRYMYIHNTPAYIHCMCTCTLQFMCTCTVHIHIHNRLAHMCRYVQVGMNQLLPIEGLEGSSKLCHKASSHHVRPRQDICPLNIGPLPSINRQQVTEPYGQELHFCWNFSAHVHGSLSITYFYSLTKLWVCGGWSHTL